MGRDLTPHDWEMEEQLGHVAVRGVEERLLIVQPASWLGEIDVKR